LAYILPSYTTFFFNNIIKFIVLAGNIYIPVLIYHSTVGWIPKYKKFVVCYGNIYVNISTVELGYNVMKGTEYFVSL
jgi:hypothetical protein